MLAMLSLLFAPKRGWIFRICRIAAFRFRCVKENVLKAMWKKETLYREGLKNWEMEKAAKPTFAKTNFPITSGMFFEELKKIHRISSSVLLAILWGLKQGGWVEKLDQSYVLTPDGRRKAATIVRLHRLWELYLASELGVTNEKIHLNAEEMEHILTPDIEERLTRLLANPKTDPHRQPIPERSLL